MSIVATRRRQRRYTVTASYRHGAGRSPSPARRPSAATERSSRRSSAPTAPSTRAATPSCARAAARAAVDHRRAVDSGAPCRRRCHRRAGRRRRGARVHRQRRVGAHGRQPRGDLDDDVDGHVRRGRARGAQRAGRRPLHAQRPAAEHGRPRVPRDGCLRGRGRPSPDRRRRVVDARRGRGQRRAVRRHRRRDLRGHARARTCARCRRRRRIDRPAGHLDLRRPPRARAARPAGVRHPDRRRCRRRHHLRDRRRRADLCHRRHRVARGLGRELHRHRGGRGSLPAGHDDRGDGDLRADHLRARDRSHGHVQPVLRSVRRWLRWRRSAQPEQHRKQAAQPRGRLRGRLEHDRQPRCRDHRGRQRHRHRRPGHVARQQPPRGHRGRRRHRPRVQAGWRRGRDGRRFRLRQRDLHDRRPRPSTTRTSPRPATSGSPRPWPPRFKRCPSQAPARSRLAAAEASRSASTVRRRPASTRSRAPSLRGSRTRRSHAPAPGRSASPPPTTR